MKSFHLAILGGFLLGMFSMATAQQASKHLLTSDELQKAVPTEYFYRGQKAPVQLRNATGFQLADGKMTLFSPVDNSGYASSIQQKYQGLLITESKLNIGGSDLPPGEYGFGFVEGKFLITDVASNEVLSTTSQTDPDLKRAVPLKVVEDGGGYKLYAGKKWVALKPE